MISQPAKEPSLIEAIHQKKSYTAVIDELCQRYDISLIERKMQYSMASKETANNECCPLFCREMSDSLKIKCPIQKSTSGASTIPDPQKSTLVEHQSAIDQFFRRYNFTTAEHYTDSLSLIHSKFMKYPKRKAEAAPPMTPEERAKKRLKIVALHPHMHKLLSTVTIYKEDIDQPGWASIARLFLASFPLPAHQQEPIN